MEWYGKIYDNPELEDGSDADSLEAYTKLSEQLRNCSEGAVIEVDYAVSVPEDYSMRVREGVTLRILPGGLIKFLGRGLFMNEGTLEVSDLNFAYSLQAEPEAVSVMIQGKLIWRDAVLEPGDVKEDEPDYLYPLI